MRRTIRLTMIQGSVHKKIQYLVGIHGGRREWHRESELGPSYLGMSRFAGVSMWRSRFSALGCDKGY